jgi:simple sugar transport system permease protein
MLGEDPKSKSATVVSIANHHQAATVKLFSSGLNLNALRRHPAGNILIIFVVLEIVCIIAASAFPDQFRYLSPLNIQSVLRAIPQLGIIAIGVGILMIAGEFDLSVGATFTLSALMMANTLDAGLPLALAVASGLMTGLIIGAINGLITLKARIPSFIATLGMMMLLRGLILYSSGTQTRPFHPGVVFETLMTGSIGLVQASFIWLLLVTFAAYLLMDRHWLGNQLYAVGGNRDAATAIGVKVPQVKLLAFVIAGGAAALSGIISTVRVSSVSPIQGQGLELQAIAACVIGGVSLYGGKGSMIGVFLGAALLYNIQDILLLLRAPGFYLDAFIGAIILVAATLNRVIQKEP